MTDRATKSAVFPNAPSLVFFVSVQGSFILGFFLLLSRLGTMPAITWLLLPLYFLFMVLLAGRPYAILVYVVAILPLTSLELLPPGYVLIAVYWGALFLLFLFRLWPFSPRSTKANTIAVLTERKILSVLGFLMLFSGLLAGIRGWATPDLARDTLMGLTVLVTVWFFATVPESTSQIRTLCYSMGALYVLVCFLLPAFSERQVGGIMGKALVAPGGLVNFNAFAAHVGATVVIFLGMLLDEKKTIRKVMLIAGISILLAALIYTRSRGAWLGLGLAFVYLVLRTRSWRMILVAGVAAVALLSTELLRYLVSTRLQATSAQDPSLWGRFLLWSYALKVFSHNWLFGVGFENFRYVKHMYGFPWPRAYGIPFNAHNIYLEFLVDLGVPGLLFLLWLLSRVLIKADKVGRLLKSQERGLALGLAAAIILYMGHGLLDCIIWQHGAFMLFGVVLGLSLSIYRLSFCGPGELLQTCRGGNVDRA